MAVTKTDDQILASAVALVRSYVANNRLPAAALPDLLKLVHGSLTPLFAKPASQPERNVPPKVTPKDIRNSVRPDGIVSFIDGKTYQVLKRHLRGNGLDPDGYRERYGLPANYPMVSAGYSERRSRLAIGIGLGTRRERSSERGRAGSALSPPRTKQSIPPP